jgi:hypothetical protein
LSIVLTASVVGTLVTYVYSQTNPEGLGKLPTVYAWGFLLAFIGYGPLFGGAYPVLR